MACSALTTPAGSSGRSYPMATLVFRPSLKLHGCWVRSAPLRWCRHLLAVRRCCWRQRPWRARAARGPFRRPRCRRPRLGMFLLRRATSRGATRCGSRRWPRGRRRHWRWPIPRARSMARAGRRTINHRRWGTAGLWAAAGSSNAPTCPVPLTPPQGRRPPGTCVGKPTTRRCPSAAIRGCWYEMTAPVDGGYAPMTGRGSRSWAVPATAPTTGNIGS